MWRSDRTRQWHDRRNFQRKVARTKVKFPNAAYTGLNQFEALVLVKRHHSPNHSRVINSGPTKFGGSDLILVDLDRRQTLQAWLGVRLEGRPIVSFFVELVDEYLFK